MSETAASSVWPRLRTVGLVLIALAVLGFLNVLSWGTLSAPLVALAAVAAVCFLHLAIWTAAWLPFAVVAWIGQGVLTCFRIIVPGAKGQGVS